MKRIILIATCALMTCASAFAQEEAEPKLVIKPTGRILMDAGVMHSTDETLDNQLNAQVVIRIILFIKVFLLLIFYKLGF